MSIKNKNNQTKKPSGDYC